MNGWEYEQKCKDYLISLGFTKVCVTKGSGDFGCDIIAEKDGKKYGIQCKYYDENDVGVKALQEAVAGSLYYECDKSLVITNARFTKQATEYAKKCNVILWPGIDAVKLVQAMKKGQTKVECEQDDAEYFEVFDFKEEAYYRFRKIQFVATKGILNATRECVSFSSDKGELFLEARNIKEISDAENMNYSGEGFGRRYKNCILFTMKDGEKIFIRIHNASYIAKLLKKNILVESKN